MDKYTLMIDDYEFDLGNFSWPISSNSTEAQQWFNRGIVWTYGFNHEEAVFCFRNAVAIDPDCSMAHWGVAYAAGPNYNKPWEFFDDEDKLKSLQTAYDASRSALELSYQSTPVEQALIKAIQPRYQSRQPTEGMNLWNDEFALEMSRVKELFPNDAFIESIFAEAMMIRTPWEFWDQDTGLPLQGSDTLKARAVLESGIERLHRLGLPTNPGLLHMYIHLMEMSKQPEVALEAAYELRNLVPDSGHLCHMSSHISNLCGDYTSTLESNSVAVEADKKYLKRYGPVNYYSFYRCHNYHFKIFGAVFLGKYKLAIDTAEELISTLPEELLKLKSPPMADWLECFVTVKHHIWVRFGKWQLILDEEFPIDRDIYCATVATMRYARAVSYAVLGKIEEAEYERMEFELAFKKVPYSRVLFGNTYLDILAVAREMMNGELEYRKGNYPLAYSHLHRAIELSDNLPYDQSWGWMQPVRHVIGALLLEQGCVNEALAHYHADLGFDPSTRRSCQHPNNIWGLSGYHECLVRLGMTDQALSVEKQLNAAKEQSEVQVSYSCYCRMN